jgi:hypothetical protein
LKSVEGHKEHARDAEKGSGRKGPEVPTSKAGPLRCSTHRNLSTSGEMLRPIVGGWPATWRDTERSRRYFARSSSIPS